MLAKSILLALLVAAGSVSAQSTAPPPPQQADSAQPLPDCRAVAVEAPHGTRCQFGGSSLPVEEYLGTISLPSDEHTRFFGVPGTPVAAAVRKPLTFDVAAIATMQSEDTNYDDDVSQGFKILVRKQWSDWWGLDLRGTIVRFNWAQIGQYAGNNHTEAVTLGPRVQHDLGIVRPYAEAQVGTGYQWRWMMSLGGAAGVEVKLAKRLSWVAADAEYRRALFEPSPSPSLDRLELSTGFAYHFGE